MTFCECKLAIQGYNKKQEDMANLMLMAMNQAQAKKPKKFTFASNNTCGKSKTNKSTIEERNETFKALGIK